MKASTPLCASLTILMLLACLNPDLGADETKPEIIDKTNWEKAEGLVPEPILDAVKKGEMILPVQEPNYDTADFLVDH